MKTGNILILDLDFEYKLWKNKLIFYRTELDLLNDRIHVLKREYADWKPENELFVLIDIQLKSVNSLESKIRTQEQEMAFYAEDYPINTKHNHYIIHEQTRQEMDKIDLRHRDIMEDIYPLLCYPLKKLLI